MALTIQSYVHNYAAQAVNYWLELSTCPGDRRALPSDESMRTLQDIIENAIAAGVLADRGQAPMRVDAPLVDQLADTDPNLERVAQTLIQGYRARVAAGDLAETAAMNAAMGIVDFIDAIMRPATGMQYHADRCVQLDGEDFCRALDASGSSWLAERIRNSRK